MFNILQGRILTVRLVLITATLALLAVGIVTIYALGHPVETSPVSDVDQLRILWKKQLIFAGVGVLGFIVANLINYRKLGSISYWLFAVTLGLLILLLVDKFINIPFIPLINGTRRWIRVSIANRPIAFQPSEVCKLVYILALAWYLRYRSNYRKFSALIGPFAFTLVPMLLILLEPDLGTVLLMMPVLFAMLFIAGAKVKHLLLIILLAIVVSPGLWLFMKDYQRTRISSVLLQSDWVRQKAENNPRFAKLLVGNSNFNTEQWRRNAGFHLIRSKYAIASGGIKGYGFGKGPFIKYDFLPERHNDFIFAAIAHQWGLYGTLGLLSLYIIIIACGVEIGYHNTDPFGRLLAFGIIAMFTVEVLINISMTLGIMPITGLTLPMVSYGGSSLLVSMTAIGLLNNVGRCRPFSLSRKPTN